MRRAHATSVGEQQKLSIAGTFMTSPSMLLLDGPKVFVPALVKAIRDALLADHADRVITLVAGQVAHPTRQA